MLLLFAKNETEESVNFFTRAINHGVSHCLAIGRVHFVSLTPVSCLISFTFGI